MFGQSNRVDSTDKAIVQWSAKHLDIVQTDVQCMQGCSVSGIAVQGEGKKEIGAEEDTGGSVRTTTDESFRENGKMEETKNVEGEEEVEGERNFKLPLVRSRDKGMKGVVDLGSAIDTTPKPCSPNKKGPLAQKAASLTLWLVYSRKRSKRKITKAHKEGDTMNQDNLSPENLNTEAKQQHQHGNGPDSQQVQKEHTNKQKA